MKQGHLKPKGFTLIELLVVIAIIALLSTIAGVALNSARQKGRDAKRVADVRQIQTALELGFDSALAFPTTSGNIFVALGVTPNTRLCQDGDGIISGSQYLFADTCVATTTTYMVKVPRDPSMSSAAAGTLCSSTATGTCEYAYKSPSSLQYEVWFRLEGATGGLAGGNTCATEAGISTMCIH